MLAALFSLDCVMTALQKYNATSVNAFKLAITQLMYYYFMQQHF